MAIDTFIFDVDGVINNGERFSSVYQALFGLEQDRMHLFFENEFEKALIGEVDLKEVLKPYLLGWKWTGTVDEFLSFWFKIDQKIDIEVVDMIIKLRDSGFKLVCATNQERYRGEFLRTDLKMDYLFSKVYVSADIGMMKSNPEFFKILQQKESLDFSKTVFIDDDQKNIDSAKSLGINAHLYKSNDELRDFISSSTSY